MQHEDEEYLTVSELSERVKYSRQTLYNMISMKRLIRGQHYLKPSRKKVLFIWSAIRAWLEEPGHDTPRKTAAPSPVVDAADSRRVKSRINI